MERKYFLIALILLINFLMTTSVLADGVHYSDSYLHLYEPDQKAVISWDGQKEIMILSSSIKSDNISNFAWVIPIQSSSKPDVSASNISVFYDLVDYFKEVESSSNIKQTTGGVAVLETKEIDVYDITILKANSSDDLIKWLNNNGYKVSEESKPVIENYIKNDTYFIANKIDLKNKYADVLNFLDIFKLGKVKAEDNPIGLTDVNSVAYILANYDSQDVAERLTDYIMTNASYINSFSGHWQDFLFVSKDEYEQLREKYPTIFSKEALENLHGMMFYVVKKARFNTSSIAIYCEYLGKNEKVYLYGDEKAEDGLYVGTCEEIESDFGSISNAQNSLKNISWSEVKKTHDNVNSEIKRIINSSLNEISFSSLKPKIESYVNDIDAISKGFGTPLKIEFQPNQSYYSLEISSLGAGNSHIEVYVIADNPVEDKNNILKIDKSKKIDSELEQKLKGYVDIGNAKYVTRLSYDGSLKNLTNDAIFDISSVQVENENIFNNAWSALQHFFDWIKSLFV